MAKWTEEQVLALAPDAASASAARGLASDGKWVSRGFSEAAAWGEAKGSGAKPYQTAVDLNDLAYKCSCPSRKFPCKHALGLMMLLARGQVPQTGMPNWTEEWLTKRSEKPAAKPQTERAPDPQAAAKRQEKRWSNILQGIDECEAFLLDAVSQGLLAMHSTRSWDQMAARMVDAQAPGIARRLKRVGSMIGVGSDWGERAAAELGTLTLAIEAARRIESLPLELQWDAKAALGIPVREDELPIEGDVADMWSVLGQSVEVEDRITTFRSWLYGMGTGKWAMHLAFSVAGQAPGLRLIPGQSFAGIGRFYPSAWPLRASFSEMSACEFKMPRGWTWEHSNERLTDALSKSPWIESLPVLISDARLGRAGDMWYAIDESDGAFPMSDHAAKRWLLLALTGNGPASLFGEWDGRRFSLLSSCAEWGFIAL